MGLDFDPLGGKQLTDPYPIYRALRDEAPCYRSNSGVWTISRYDDVLHVLKTPEVFSSRAMITVLLQNERDSGPLLEGIFFIFRAWWKIGMSPPSPWTS
jgi:cytochrome P450